ncbi:transposase family protein [Actinomyces sp.]|uniref:transposase family protein n=1 Tax=Actinomyces sp. TaxID=29317 RepID=UPI0026DA9904|nr:transposase family protein [Actinomyces sp.]MDO4900119.1 transposase family protein [Actinomyces sp.]
MTCALSGTIAWVSDPVPGSAHDTAALRASVLLDLPLDHLPDDQDSARHIGDKDYTGLGMTTPARKQPGRLSMYSRLVKCSASP